MHARGIDILALQETHEKPKHPLKPGTQHTWHGCLSHGRRKGGGSGFLVSNKVASIFKYLGVKGPVGPHATVWGYVKGKHKTNDLYIGNVYLPHTGRTKEFIANARAALADDVAHYQQKAGNVILVGDFNARVGRHEGPVPEIYLPREDP
jgi:exonuclease III